MVGAEGLVVVFWFAGFVALAVFLSGRICFGMVCLTFLFLLCLSLPDVVGVETARARAYSL
jgi:hypothetical protein